MSPELELAARQFATDLTETLHATVGPSCPPFRLQQIGEYFAVSQQPAAGIPLHRGGEEWVRLEATYLCEWNTAQEYMRTQKSAIRLLYGDNPQPLFRYEYVRSLHEGPLPAAHLHVHEAATGDLAALMADGGDMSRRSRTRKQQIEQGVPPRQSDIHFPLGGDRYRPILEDVLQMLIEEYGLDVQPGWYATLASARERWRLIQVAAAVSDAPDVAAEKLRKLGYDVVAPHSGEPPRNSANLRAI